MKKILVLCLSILLISCDDGEKERLRNELQNCESEKEELNKQISGLEDKVSDLEGELEECVSTVKRYKSDLEDVELEQDMNDLNK